MAEFVTQNDIQDEVLRGRMPDECIENANQYVTRIAGVYGVQKITVRHTTKQLAIAIACRDCCLSLVGTDATVAMDGNRQDDIYERKYNLYRQRAADMQKTLTRADFMSDEETDEEEEREAWTRTMGITRG